MTAQRHHNATTISPGDTAMDDHRPRAEGNWPQEIAEMEELNKSLAERIDQLERENVRLKNVMQQKEEYVVALSHDLKNPLLGSTKLLEFLGDQAMADEDKAALVTQLIDSNKGILRMIWNLLDVYRQDAGIIKPVIKSLDIGLLLNECMAEFRFNIKTKNINLVVSIDENLPTVMSDQILLRRILINLLDNAVKFTPVGGTLVLAASMEQAQVKISVKNSGRGMTPAQITNVFQRFWQTEHGRENVTGTGLGLFLSQQLVLLLGGKIECESVEAVGTEFKLYLDSECERL